MHRIRVLILTTLAMLAFAGNSLLCRLALKNTNIDPASFTGIRLFSGAAILLLIAGIKNKRFPATGNWWSALALFIYAAAFSFAYVHLSAASGALLLFGAVQASMIAYGIYRGERLDVLQLIGFAVAIGGLIVLLMPGLSSPPVSSSLLMISAGIAWGIYSLRGKSGGDATAVTAGNFLRSLAFALPLMLFMAGSQSLDNAGVFYALCSGALTSGIGYVIWYAALPSLKATTAASVQLAVPALAAAGGIFLLGEPASWRLALASFAILGGIALVVSGKSKT